MSPADWFRFAWDIAWLPGCAVLIGIASTTPTWITFWARVDERADV